MTDNVTNIKTRAEADALAEVIGKLHTPQQISISRGSSTSAAVLALPGRDGIKLESLKPYLDEYLQAPERRTGTATMLTLESFVAHVVRFSDEHSELFCDNADPKAPYLLAVLDYHQRGAAGLPRFGHHQTRYNFPLSDEWRAWIGSNNFSMKQAQFAAFLEDRLTDVMDPGDIQLGGKKLLEKLGLVPAGVAKLLELSKGLRLNVNRVVGNEANLYSGEGQIIFKESHSAEGGKAVDVPNSFAIGIPVFKGDQSYQVIARLRYRVGDGGITWSYTLYKPEVVFDDAVARACEVAEKGTGLELLYGTPEAQSAELED